MIRSFRHRGLKRFFDREDRSGLRLDMVNVIQEILTVLDEATDPQQLNLPGLSSSPAQGRVERLLVGDGPGQLADYVSL